MAIKDKKITDRYAIYHADCMQVMDKLPSDKIGLSIYSPPFGGLYNYSSDERDLSNCDDYGEFFKHYEYVIRDLFRITIPGRITAVHCMDIPRSNSGKGDSYIDFPGHIIRVHEKIGFEFRGRRAIWKEPLGVRLRTMQKNLAHQTVVEDSAASGVAAADYILCFAKKGENKIPVEYPKGLQSYSGERQVPEDLLMYKKWKGKQTENRYSHWIWRQYASSVWMDIRLNNVLPFQDSKDENDEKHVHPLQLDVIERLVILYSNQGETVFTPFMGVGSEVYGALINGRRGIGVELKESYYKQAVMNLENAKYRGDQQNLFNI
ncbi:MAG TPA: site-specific DNA-methyltransferase [bacterium]|nr:site-specific DNA-methyltransferase [bacterium]